MNILDEANKIVNLRSEEKERMYGSFNESMDRATAIYNASSPKDEQISTRGMYRAMVALKLSREAYSHKEDNLLDAVAYLGALNNYIEEVEKIPRERETSAATYCFQNGKRCNGCSEKSVCSTCSKGNLFDTPDSNVEETENRPQTIEEILEQDCANCNLRGEGDICESCDIDRYKRSEYCLQCEHIKSDCCLSCINGSNRSNQ